MTESPRWERESQEDLRPPETEPQQTTELSSPLDEGVDRPWSDGEEDGEWPAREPRLAAARESLTATRDSVGESLSATRESLSARASKVGRWLHALDRRPEFDAGTGRDPVAELTTGSAESREPAEAESQPAARGPESEDTAVPPPLDDDRQFGVRFPTAALGYNRQAVDDHIAALEEEIAELRNVIEPPPTIEEEIERLGEQTASILVIAHDKAHETARRAQEQAARSVREAARNAERITSEAERRLRQLDEETDAVWRERERLLADVREVSLTLGTLVDAATERFPAAPEPAGATATT
jgi:DNA repair exonuclease SbcCD ATPase subunit